MVFQITFPFFACISYFSFTCCRTSEFESRIKLLRYDPEMPSFVLSKKLQKHRQAIMSDSTRQLVIDRS